LGRRSTVSRCLIRINPRLEILGRKLWECQEEIAEIAFGIDRDGRDTVDCRLLEQGNAESRLAAAGHADTDCVRRQILRIVQHGAVGGPALRKVVFATKVKCSELFVIHQLLVVACGWNSDSTEWHRSGLNGRWVLRSLHRKYLDTPPHRPI